MIDINYSSGNVAVTHDDKPPDGGSLHLTGSMFFGSVQKTPGTEVADTRDSTSYCGTEYSWYPIEHIYG